jgi:multicomponent Na+:H+ antiporter subunit E
MKQALNNNLVRKPLPERLVLFAVAFVFWLILVWPMAPDGSFLWSDIWMGLAVAVIVALVMKEFIRVNFIRLVKPLSWFWGFVYIFVFSWYVLRGGLDVAWRVLHPAMPIRPGVVRMKSTLETATGRTALANSITLTPGTLTLDVTDDGVFYVHWLYVTTLDDEEAAGLILRRFEWYIKRIFE